MSTNAVVVNQAIAGVESVLYISSFLIAWMYYWQYWVRPMDPKSLVKQRLLCTVKTHPAQRSYHNVNTKFTCCNLLNSFSYEISLSEISILPIWQLKFWFQLQVCIYFKFNFSYFFINYFKLLLLLFKILSKSLWRYCKVVARSWAVNQTDTSLTTPSMDF